MSEDARERSGPDEGPRTPTIHTVLEAGQEVAATHANAHVKVIEPKPWDVERAELRWRRRRLGKRIVVQASDVDGSVKVEAVAETDLLVLPPWATHAVRVLRALAFPVVAFWVWAALLFAYEMWPLRSDDIISAFGWLAVAAPVVYYLARPAGTKVSVYRAIGVLPPTEAELEAPCPRDLMAGAWEWLESLTAADVVSASREAERAAEGALQAYAGASGLMVKRGADRQWWLVGPQVRVEVNARPLSEIVLSDRSPGRGRVQGRVLEWAELPRLGEHLDSLQSHLDEEDDRAHSQFEARTHLPVTRLHDRARAVGGEALRRQTEPWRRLSVTLSVAWKASLLAALLSFSIACMLVPTTGPATAEPWWPLSEVAWYALAGLAGLLRIAESLANWRLATELDRLGSEDGGAAG